jgi:hypothetical protein
LIFRIDVKERPSPLRPKYNAPGIKIGFDRIIKPVILKKLLDRERLFQALRDINENGFLFHLSCNAGGEGCVDVRTHVLCIRFGHGFQVLPGVWILKRFAHFLNYGFQPQPKKQ